MQFLGKALRCLSRPKKPAAEIRLVGTPAPGYPDGHAFHVYPAGKRPEKPIVVMVSPREMALK